MNKKIVIAGILGVILGAGILALFQGRTASAGPHGGDLVPLDSSTKAEIVANADSGEVMAHTYGSDGKTAKPIDANPLSLGSGQQSVDLEPQPLPSDPPGRCSRFYGRADWLRGGQIRHGWIHGAGFDHREFGWNNCWKGGQSHGPMWGEIRGHGPMGMGPGMGAGASGPGHRE